jgi:ketosteroid isomerase-like protein
MQTPLEALHEYYSAFSTLDTRAITSFYCEPSMTVAPQGVFAAASHAALANSLAPIIDGLRAKGYARSQFVQPTVTSLGETASLVRGVAVRYTAAGSEIERIPLAYLMRRSEAGWKIAVLVVES